MGAIDLDDWPSFEQAACRAPGADPSWWFPERGQFEALQRARKVCAGCAHLVDCGEFGITRARALVGVWGGLSQHERILAARRRRILVLAPPVGDDRRTVDDIAPAIPEPVDGNGHSQPVSPMGESSQPGPACVICSQPIPERRGRGAKTCGDDCAEEHRKQRRAAYEANKRASINPATAPRTPPYSENTKNVLPEYDGPATAPSGLPGALNGYLVGYLLDVNGEQWTLTRSTTNGGPP